MIKDYEFLKERIMKIITSSQLDIGAIYFILKDIYINIEALYYSQINKELQDEEKIETIDFTNDQGEE